MSIVGSRRFNNTTKMVEKTLMVEGAQNATRLIYNVTQTIGEMKLDIEPYDKGVAKRLDNTTTKLNKASITLLDAVHDHKSLFDSFLRTL